MSTALSGDYRSPITHTLLDVVWHKPSQIHCKHPGCSHPKKWVEQIQPKIIILMLTSDNLGEIDLLKTHKICYSAKWNLVTLSRNKIDRIPPGALMTIDTILMAWAKMEFRKTASKRSLLEGGALFRE